MTPVPAGNRSPLFLLSVSLLSAAALAYEVLLLRLFSLSLWHHFASTVISLALLGYGASGTLLTLVGPRLRGRFPGAFRAGALLFGVAAPACYALSQKIPFNPLALAWEVRPWAAFSAMYLILAVPFLLAAGCVGLALRQLGDRIPVIYRADLLGAGAGALGVLGCLSLLPPEGCLRAIGVAGCTAAGLSGLGASPARPRAPALAVLTAGAGVLLSLGWPSAWITPRVSEYKDLPQTLRAPGAAVVADTFGPLGEVAAVTSPTVPLRHAPGLSLTCPAPIPEQAALFVDGDLAGVVDEADRGSTGYLDCLPGALPFELLGHPGVLVLGAGGGVAVRNALVQGATRVDAVELNPALFEMVRGPLGPFSGRLYEGERVRFHAADARAFLSSNQGRYDLIEIPFLAGGGGGTGGVGALAESYLTTVEALEGMLGHLAPRGALSVTLALEVPPRGALKFVATVLEALDRRGATEPASWVAVTRTWNTVTVLVREGGLGPEDLDAIRRFCRSRGFDLAYLPGLERHEANRSNVLQEPYLYDGVRALLGPGRAEFLRRYKFYVVPATDDRPYFSRTFRWGSLGEFLGKRAGGGAALVEWGYLLSLASFLQAVVAGALLILLPLRRLRAAPGSPGQGPGVGLYFGSLGLAFLFVEIPTIHRTTLLLGHPVYAAAGVLSGFLVFAGLGSGVSGRLVRKWGEAQVVRGAVGGIAALVAAHQWLLPGALPVLGPHPLTTRGLVAAAAIAPLAFLMGMPFPVGLAALSRRDPEWVPWAWGLNGFASVWSAALAGLLSIHLGFSGVIWIAVAFYLLAASATRGW